MQQTDSPGIHTPLVCHHWYQAFHHWYQAYYASCGEGANPMKSICLGTLQGAAATTNEALHPQPVLPHLVPPTPCSGVLPHRTAIPQVTRPKTVEQHPRGSRAAVLVCGTGASRGCRRTHRGPAQLSCFRRQACCTLHHHLLMPQAAAVWPRRLPSHYSCAPRRQRQSPPAVPQDSMSLPESPPSPRQPPAS